MIQNLSPTQLQKHLYTTEHKPLLLDVREPWEYDICHISGSTLVPMHKLVSNVDALDPEEEMVVICHHGIRSRMIARFLSSRGFQKIINLHGGIDAWSDQVDRTMAKY